MKNFINTLLFIIALIMTTSNVNAQCVTNEANIYSFDYNGHTYQVVKEINNWIDAALCAVENGGYLTEINDEAEQIAIYNELDNNAGIILTETQNRFSRAAIWIGGSDLAAEGVWILDGDNDGVGPQFWEGGVNGNPIGGLYNNWGMEPDNSSDQDALSMALEDTPLNLEGEWNDLGELENSMFYVIEYNTVLGSNENELKSNIDVYPNPFINYITIKNNNESPIQNISLINIVGQQIKKYSNNDIESGYLRVSDLNKGIYFLIIEFETGKSITLKMIK